MKLPETSHSLRACRLLSKKAPFIFTEGDTDAHGNANSKEFLTRPLCSALFQLLFCQLLDSIFWIDDVPVQYCSTPDLACHCRFLLRIQPWQRKTLLKK